MTLDVSYNQIAIFDPAIETPFNDWTDSHIKQGFSYRKESACFECLGDGIYTLEVLEDPFTPIIMDDFDRAFHFPFDKPQEKIEVASIYSSQLITFNKCYKSYHLLIVSGRIAIIPCMDSTGLEILKLDKPIPDELLLNSDPA